MNRKKILLKKEEILKEFQTILALEEEAAKSYQQLSQDCGDLLTKQLLSEIAQEEKTHVSIAQKLIKIALELVPQGNEPTEQTLNPESSEPLY